MNSTFSLGRYIFLAFTFLLFWGVFAGNYDNGDFIYYDIDYDSGKDRFEELKIEPLFAYINIMAQKYFECKTYWDFKVYFSFAFMIPYWYTINKWSESSTLTLLFFLPLFLLQIVIIRNFMAFAVVQLVIPLLIKPNKTNLLIFLSGVLLAQGIHNMMFLYLLALLALFHFRVFDRPLVFILLCFLIGAMVGQLLFSFMSSLAISKYGTMEETGLNFLRMLFGVFLLPNYICLAYIKKRTPESKDSRVEKFESLILKLNLVFMLLIVIFVISVVASRIFINLLLFNMIFVANRTCRYFRTTHRILWPAVPYVAFWIWYITFGVVAPHAERLFFSNYFVDYIIKII